MLKLIFDIYLLIIVKYHLYICNHIVKHKRYPLLRSSIPAPKTINIIQ